MPLPIGDTIGILSDNLRKRNSVLPISAAAATGWARGMDLPRGGPAVIYTGQMYQLVPYIAAMGRTQDRVEDTWLAGFVGLGRAANRVINISAFMARPQRSLKAACDGVLRNIARLLRKAGVEFGYLYEDELYSGALVHDLGMDETAADHAVKVYDLMKRYRVERVITVDPHSTSMLRSVYPKLVKGYDIQVESYLEVLADSGLKPVRTLTGEVAVHDSCVYARYEDTVRQPRELLAGTGLEVKEPLEAGKFTRCCGGPVESLYPGKALAGACARVDQLKKVSGQAAAMCPICLVNLARAAGDKMKVQDISDILVQAYCD